MDLAIVMTLDSVHSASGMLTVFKPKLKLHFNRGKQTGNGNTGTVTALFSMASFQLWKFIVIATDRVVHTQAPFNHCNDASACTLVKDTYSDGPVHVSSVCDSLCHRCIVGLP